MLAEIRARLERTWHETDGGSHEARGSAAGACTARAHGLLISHRPDGSPVVLLHQFEEWIRIGEARYPLSTTLYRDLRDSKRLHRHPDGVSILESFHAAPFPRWVFRVGDRRLIKTLGPAAPGAGFTLAYHLVPSPVAGGEDGSEVYAASVLELRPLVSGRAANELSGEFRCPDAGLFHSDANPAGAAGGAWTWSSPGGDRLVFSLPPGTTWSPGGHWYRGLRLIAEGQDEESVWSPGVFSIPLADGGSVTIRLATGEVPAAGSSAPPPVIVSARRVPAAAEAALRRSIRWNDRDAFLSRSSDVSEPADLFESILALLRLAECLDAEILKALARGTWARLHARIPEATLDVRLAAVLTLAELCRRGVHDPDRSREALRGIDRLLEGTDTAALPSFGNLLEVVRPGESFWDRTEPAGTPHRRYPIDIQFLWANALAGAEILHSVTSPGARSPRYGKHFLAVAETIRRRYWDPARACIADDLTVLAGDSHAEDRGPTLSARTSSAAVLGLSLRFEVLPPSRARATLQQAAQMLAFESHPRSAGRAGIPLGLRTFADRRRVHPWLLAAWLIAENRASGDAANSRAVAGAVLKYFTIDETTVVPDWLDPVPPHPLDDPRSPNRIRLSGPSVATLAGLVLASSSPPG